MDFNLVPGGLKYEPMFHVQMFHVIGSPESKFCLKYFLKFSLIKLHYSPSLLCTVTCSIAQRCS